MWFGNNNNNNNNNNGGSSATEKSRETPLAASAVNAAVGAAVGGALPVGTSSNLSDPNVIWSKLQEVTNSVRDSLPASKEQVSENMMQVGFLALLKFLTELKRNSDTFKNDVYCRDGSHTVSGPEAEDLSYWFDFADAAYFEDEKATERLLTEILRPRGYHLIRHHNFPEPGRVGHFVAVNHDTKIVVVSIKGTSNLADVLTDVMANATEHELPFPVTTCYDPTGKKNEEGSFLTSFFDDWKKTTTTTTHICVHDAIGSAAWALADEIQHMIEIMFLPQGYKVVLTGHSLGAGAACLLGIFLHSRIPSLRKVTRDSPLVVRAYATPAVADLNTALACQSFITSVVHNDDVVPRASIVNFVTMIHAVERMAKRLQEHNLDLSSIGGANALLQLLMAKGEDAGNEKIQKLLALFSPEEIQGILDEIQNSKRIEEDGALVVPGRVVCFWNQPNSTASTQESKTTKDQTKETKEQDEPVSSGDDDKTKEQQEEPPAVIPLVDARAMNAKMVPLRYIEISDTMISDHGTACYRAAFENFLNQRRN